MLFRTVAVTGGAGYVGSALVSRLASLGYRVKVLDLFLYGDPLGVIPNVEKSRGDLRDEAWLTRELKGVDAVLHLACVSNDPSFELDPGLGKSINYDAFAGLLRAVKAGGAKRFIYASSSSVYGIREEADVREDSPCDPLTDYSKFKLLCEKDLAAADMGDVEWVIARPSTVCGYAPRMRLDLVVNILTINALVKKAITVFGGAQLRPNIHVDDMVDAYALLLEAPRSKAHRQTFNIGYENYPVSVLAEKVKAALGDPEVTITAKPTNDPRSYHVNSDRIRRSLGFIARRTIEDAVRGIADAFREGKLQDPLNNPLYHNIKLMQKVNLGKTGVTAS